MAPGVQSIFAPTNPGVVYWRNRLCCVHHHEHKITWKNYKEVCPKCYWMFEIYKRIAWDQANSVWNKKDPTLLMISPYLRKSGYCIPSTRITEQCSKYQRSASQNQFSHPNKRSATDLGTTQWIPNVAKATHHKPQATSQSSSKWFIISPLLRHIQHQPTSENPLLIRLSWLRILPQAASKILW